MIAHTSPVEHGALAVVGVVAVVAYATGWWRRPGAPAWSLPAWAAGVIAVEAALSPAVERWADRTFTGHMVQHLLLVAVAAPLLVLARPIVTMAVATRPPSNAVGDRRVAVVHGVLPRRVRAAWHRHAALVGAGLFAGVLVVTHLTAIYDLALTHRWLHDAEHVAYLASAVALWAGLSTSTSRTTPSARIGPVFAVIAAMAFTGVILLSARSPLVPTYAARAGGDAALADQRRAASLMWVAGMGITLPLLLLSVWRWASTEERIARRAEALADASDALTHPPRSIGPGLSSGRRD